MNSLGIDLGAPPQTRQEIVADRIRDAILRGYFKPGQRLDQNEIANLLKVSRSPIREALRTLAAEGLVEVIPHHGAVVTELSLTELEEILVLRGVLESMAARLAVRKIDADQLKTLEAILKELNHTTDLDRWIELNHAFHHTIYLAANRPRLMSLIDNLRNTVTPYMRQFIASTEHMRDAAASHQSIYDACVNHDPSRIEQETQTHLAAASEGMVIYAKSLPATPFAQTNPSIPQSMFPVQAS